MAALNVTVPTVGGTLVGAQTGSATDTLTLSQLSPNGVYLVATAGGSAANVTISDASLTAVGHAWTPAAVSVSAGTKRAFFISPAQADKSTSLVTITSTNTPTYEVYPA